MKKKIIYTISTLAITLLFGLGCFNGSKPLVRKAKAEETTQVQGLNRKERKLSSSTDFTSLTGTYYIVAKNISTNGEGVFYQNSVSPDNTAMYLQRYANSTLARADFTIIRNGDYYHKSLWFDSSLNGGVYKPSLIYFGGQTNSVIWSWNAGLTNANACFVATDFTYMDEYFLERLFQFFEVYELQDDFFEFADNINYYSPYGQDISSYYVNDSTMTEASSTAVKTILSGINFYSGGMVFDTIRLRYQNAISTSYKDDSGNRQTWSVNGFASYLYTEYYNSVSNIVVVVNERIYQPWNSGNSSGYLQTKGSKWISKNYQKIQFFQDVNSAKLTELSKLNNSAFEGGYQQEGADIGLNNAFTLIGQAFTAWLPILSVSVIPGITLGMLIFLPLVAGIIILIIWIVKR